MAKFKQIPQNFLFRQLLHFWKNQVAKHGLEALIPEAKEE
jgi:hypothetical protein